MTATSKALSCSIDCSTVVTITTEYTVEGDVMTGKDVQSITPAWMRDAAHVVQSHIMTIPYWTGVDSEAIYKYVVRPIYMCSFVSSAWTCNAPAKNTNIMGIVDGKGACEITASLKIDGSVGWYKDSVLIIIPNSSLGVIL